MNYNVKLCGRKSHPSTLSAVTKLIIESMSASDYVTHIYSRQVLAPYSTMMLEMDVVGSSKKDIMSVVLDCDSAYIGIKADIHITPELLDIERMDNLSHYWGVCGALFKIITDLSPAYITSHLLDNKMSKELALFKQYSTINLPADMQETVIKFGLSN